MATDTIIILEQLRCINLINTEAQTEPYIWPALIRVDDNTLATPGLISIFTPVLGNARVVIKDSIRAGETAPIPDSVGILRARFDDKLAVRRLILVVALLEKDETPEAAMRAGYQAFSSELAAAIAENLLALDAASDEEQKVIIDEIKKRVERRVRSAVEGGLSSYEKLKVLAGFLNLDDHVASAFKSFRPKGPVADPTPTLARIRDLENFEPTTFTMPFEAKGNVGGIFDTLSHYQIDGQLQVRPVVVDRCKAQIDAVNAAQSVVDGIEAEIDALQDELQNASPTEKPFLNSEIKRLKTEELPPAVAALDEARRALEACRSFRPRGADADIVALGAERVAVLEPVGNGYGRPQGDGSVVTPRSTGFSR